MSKSVLLVEDDKAQRKLYGDYLRSHGVDVTLADGGRDALDHDWGKFDLVVTDLMMPGMDGDDMIDVAVGRKAGGKLPPIILFSAVDKTALDRMAAREWGRDLRIQLLPKTITLAEFLGRVRQGMATAQ